MFTRKLGLQKGKVQTQTGESKTSNMDVNFVMV